MDEETIIKHVQKYARYYGIPKRYGVEWSGKTYFADDTRTLVLLICRDEGVET